MTIHHFTTPENIESSCVCGGCTVQQASNSWNRGVMISLEEAKGRCEREIPDRWDGQGRWIGSNGQPEK